MNRTAALLCKLRVETFADGSSVCPHEWIEGRWVAWWPKSVPLRGEDPRTGLEVDWAFTSRDEALDALGEGGCGPRAVIQNNI